MSYDADVLSGAHYYARYADNLIFAALEALRRGHLHGKLVVTDRDGGSADYNVANAVRIGHWLA